jgi:hypothetical protein
MKKQLLALAFVLCAIKGLAADATAVCPDQSDFPWIVCQPVNQLVPIGSTAVFSVTANNGPLTYQWLSNGIAMTDQTNASLVLTNVQPSTAGFYSCNLSKDWEVVPTRSASLLVYTNYVNPATGVDPVTIFAPPVISGGKSGTCPGSYAGYVIYTKTAANGWGWAPDTNNTTTFTASDGGGRLDTSVIYTGKNLDSGCALTTVTIPNPPYSPKYRFAIYFPNNVPTTNYPIVLDGFLP